MAPSREPWIENMIINHGTEKEKNIANLKARVIAVGKMTNSQALGVQGPPQLLFLSDGVVQIPAILTDTAWENLQEDEERECFSSLVNTTVCLQTYSLQFYMAPEKRKSKFFLSLSNLAATAAGPIKEGPPCCTTLSSVRVKISDTWKALQHQNLAQTEISQSAIDLTQLLGVWQEDCLMDLVAEVRERLTAARRTTVRCKGAETFSIPMAHLIIPDTAALSLRPPTQPGEGSTQQSGLIPPSGDPPVLHSTPAAKPKASSSRPRAEPQDEVDADQSNPWNMFPPPSKVFCTSSASTSSPADCGDLAEHSAIQPSGGKSPGPVEDHHQPPPGPAGVAEQGGVPCVDLSPPSWLFESHPGPVPEPRRSSQQGRVAGGGTYSPVVHGDGSSFSYRYKVSVKTVMDLSRFRVADDHLNWAVKYLVVPRHTDINNM
uniref:Shelterin complex subunit TPP1/Est3 domain-containing protein n=1 Tax=Gadus morhua TaxID=8049 RepID=A0A8C5AEV1_GADMO